MVALALIAARAVAWVFGMLLARRIHTGTETGWLKESNLRVPTIKTVTLTIARFLLGVIGVFLSQRTREISTVGP